MRVDEVGGGGDVRTLIKDVDVRRLISKCKMRCDEFKGIRFSCCVD